MPFALLFCAWILLFHRDRPVVARLVCVMLLPVLIGAAIQVFSPNDHYEWSFGLLPTLFEEGLGMVGGGLLGGLLALALSAAVSAVGAAIVLIVGLVALLFAAFRLSPVRLVDLVRRRRGKRRTAPAKPPREEGVAVLGPEPKRNRRAQLPPPWGDTLSASERRRRQVDIPVPGIDLDPQLPTENPETDAVPPPPPSERRPPTEMAPAPGIPPTDHVIREGVSANSYRLPPISLLTGARQTSAPPDGTRELNNNATLLMDTIKSFGIEASIVSVTRGPAVARYELELDRGIKLSRLTGLSDDIALSLGTSGVRIAPVPGKMSVVGIEVPNRLVSIVHLKDVLSSPEFASASGKVAFALGRDIGGAPIVCDLTRLTHLLIAGTTGSGKSVCMNSLIVSLLYKATPEEVQLLMIDPKMVELGVYDGIPHLLVPVVTDFKRAAGALYKVVIEMEDRYRKFMKRHVRDIFSYNASLAADPEARGETPLPQIVVIIDELADLMMAAAREVEESICRIAQKARAAGIHLVIATQLPSADVITGLMKANIPSRIAFAVASQLESRIILDTMGAEKLVGRGDMLLYPLGSPKPFRVQGCLITSAEVEKVVEAVKKSGAARYNEDFLESIEVYAEQVGKKGGLGAVSADGEMAPAFGMDDIFITAVEVVMESGQASVSYLQRRLKLGFSRAARIVDQMEERGIVGPSEGSKPRQLLIGRQQWQEMMMKGQETT